MRLHILALALIASPACALAQTDLEPPPQAIALPTDTPIPHTDAIARGKRAYVVNDCYSCHGGYQVPDPRHGDLAKSKLVIADNNGTVLRSWIHSGSVCTVGHEGAMMPSYADIPDPELADLITYLHFQRQTLQYAQLSKAAPASGDATLGKQLFSDQCAACHTAQALHRSAAQYDAPTFRRRLLLPVAASVSPKTSAGLGAHQKLLERYTPQELDDLTAYIQSIK
jgi:mono/diheme cytochrome c family protein